MSTQQGQIPLNLGEGNHGNLRRSDGMAAGVESGWHQASGHHQSLISTGGRQLGDNTHQFRPSQGGQRQDTFVANNNSSPHAYVPLNQPIKCLTNQLWLVCLIMGIF